MWKGLPLTAHVRMSGPVWPLYLVGLGLSCVFRFRACVKLRSSLVIPECEHVGLAGFVFVVVLFVCLFVYALLRSAILKTHKPVLANKESWKVRKNLRRTWK